ncbi:DUF2884 family protein [Vibrio hannami]|uniref:DUF2884 family protein n=1 Tax=Vibrio hannami TaxID=2717094 RepID=UPI0024101245|nr:DUF2884 family protein [Vibrio hannami]MDG3087381.1 DUF2884 family protein [Vibrio hannami]
MKKLLLGFALLFCSTAFAQSQCKVDIQNEVHLDGKQVEIYQDDVPKVLIDQDNQLFINGQKMELSATQQAALDSYRSNLNEYLPKAKEIARDGLALMNDVLDDIAVSFNNSEAFNNVKKVLEEFLTKLEKRYYKEDGFVMQKAAFSDAFNNWKQDFADARETFNSEFFSSAFDALSQKMKQEGGINLTELKEELMSLKQNLDGKLQADSAELQQDAQQYCEDVEKVAEEEKMLHEKIPELKDYQVFLI